MTGGRPLHVLLASPRGFCAGVARAVEALDQALSHYGPPVYVRHEIVHNPEVVERFRGRGAIFIDDLDDVPAGARLFLSAHGVAPEVKFEAARRGLRVVDTTCPLVSKVHAEARRLSTSGRTTIVIGHRGHVEVEGTVGWLNGAPHHVVETAEEAQTLPLDRARPHAYLTQTTLSLDETAEVVGALRSRLPDLQGPPSADICFATTNRQHAVKAISGRSDVVLVLGGRNSSNSLRLVETALRAGAPRAWLLERPEDLDAHSLEDCRSVGLTGGASTPETSLQAVLDRLKASFEVSVEEIGAPETVRFRAASMASLD